ncbi:hypothetical protein GCM10020255_036320 [Rhodococcus baikonurensis]
MMPVGLLTPIGAALVESEGTIGLSLVITGLVAAATAPFVPVVTRRFDRRSTLIVLMLFVAAANALTALAPSFAVLAVARVLLGVSMGGVWALAASLAPRLVETRSVGLATTIIFSGIAVASVFGVPAGTYIGAAAGWSVAFWALSCAAAVIALAMFAVLPTMRPIKPCRSAVSWRLFGTRESGSESQLPLSSSPLISRPTPMCVRDWSSLQGRTLRRSAPCS